MKKNIAVLAGDGVGPEIINATLVVLRKIEKKFDHSFTFTEGLIGGVAIDQTGNPYPDETDSLCMKSDAVLFGAIGNPKYDNDPSLKVRPEQGLLKMRKNLGLYANIRPIRTFDALLQKSPLKVERVKNVNFVVVRELIGGIYFGNRGREQGGKIAYDTSSYSVFEIERIGKTAFEFAQKRRKKVCLVDKANVLETSRLWRETIRSLSNKYTDVEVEYMFVDNAAMQIIKNPSSFDVILTENLFGDILSDEASVITGSIGMLPSASIGDKISLYEPIHGSYPKATGLNTANPIGTILSAALMLEMSFGLMKEAEAIRMAVDHVLSHGLGTKDIVSDNPLSTTEMAEKIAQNI